MTAMEWHRACRANALAEGEVVGVKIGQTPIALYRVDGAIHATSDVCTHAFALLSTGFLDGHVIECPLHGATFNVLSGKCLAAGHRDLDLYEVKVDGEDIMVRAAARASADAAASPTGPDEIAFFAGGGFK